MSSPDLPGREVTLLLCDATGDLLGTLPPFPVTEPWWPEVGDVVAECRRRYAVEVAVLRVLPTGTEPRPAGGEVTYLAEVRSGAPGVPVAAWDRPPPLADHPLRLPYARPGGPAAEVAWADARLREAGRPRTGPAVQVRTWNLSSIWRLPTAAGTAWLKAVPPFFAHEGAMLRRLDPDVVPALVAAEGPRVLLDEVPGEDHWGAPLPVLLRVLELLVGLQASWVTRHAELLAVGAPDWRAHALVPAVERLVDRAGSRLEDDVRRPLDALVADLPQRLADVAACGLPDTLVHGDFHPGNTRGSPAEGGRSVLLDWGDCGLGNPLLDQSAFLASIAEEQREPVRERWARLWRTAVPGSDPARAADLLTPVAALRQALIYQSFLDAIEPDERAYHAGDPPNWLGRAAATSGWAGPQGAGSTRG
jgi:hypothetical protein